MNHELDRIMNRYMPSRNIKEIIFFKKKIIRKCRIRSSCKATRKKSKCSDFLLLGRKKAGTLLSAMKPTERDRYRKLNLHSSPSHKNPHHNTVTTPELNCCMRTLKRKESESSQRKKKALFSLNAPSRLNIANALKRGGKKSQLRQNLTSKQQSKTKGKQLRKSVLGEAWGRSSCPDEHTEAEKEWLSKHFESRFFPPKSRLECN